MTKEELIQKLCSRKFWFAAAVTLSSLATAFAGFSTGNDWIWAIALVCSVASGGIYEFVNAWDAVGNAQANCTTTTKTVTAQATDKATVQAVMGTASE